MTHPGEFITHGTLGGYYHGGDPDSMSTALWDWLIDILGCESMVDVGAGEAQAAQHWRARGRFAVAIDGVENPGVDVWDFTEGPFPWDNIDGSDLQLVTGFDLAWSSEFVEHVEEQYVDNFMPTFQKAHTVVMTHGLPGQAGWHHVNCQPSSYWIERFSTAGFAYDDEMTALAKDVVRHDPNVNVDTHYFLKSGLAFVRRPTGPLL